MNALSRREEGKIAFWIQRLAHWIENLLKITKERAVKECHEVVKGSNANSCPFFSAEQDTAFADCVQGRTISVAWACRPQLRKMEECIVL
jgi:COX assembly protein 1